FKLAVTWNGTYEQCAGCGALPVYSHPAHALTSQRYVDGSAAYSPTGGMLVWSTNKFQSTNPRTEAPRELMTMSLTGTVPTQRTTTSTLDEYGPTWQAR